MQSKVDNDMLNNGYGDTEPFSIDIVDSVGNNVSISCNQGSGWNLRAHIENFDCQGRQTEYEQQQRTAVKLSPVSSYSTYDREILSTDSSLALRPSIAGSTYIHLIRKCNCIQYVER